MKEVTRKFSGVAAFFGLLAVASAFFFILVLIDRDTTPENMFSFRRLIFGYMIYTIPSFSAGLFLFNVQRKRGKRRAFVDAVLGVFATIIVLLLIFYLLQGLGVMGRR